jgi:hypothetical protein
LSIFFNAKITDEVRRKHLYQGSVFVQSASPYAQKLCQLAVDLCTIHLDDFLNHAGARNVDSECTGTTMGDYLRGADLSHVPPEVTIAYGV